MFSLPANPPTLHKYILFFIIYILYLYQATSHDVSREGEDEEEEYEVQEGSDYDYLLDMKISALTKEKRKKLLRHRDEKKQEVQKLKVQ